MTFHAETKVDWQGEKEMASVNLSVETASKKAAAVVARKARANLRSKLSRTASDELPASIKAAPSKYGDNNFIVGIFGKATAIWTDSIGAKAVFFEYGRSAKGRGRGGSDKRKGQKPGDRAQPPRPFLRPALYSTKLQFLGITQDEIRKALR